MREFVNNLLDWGASGLLAAALLDGAGLPIPGGVDLLIAFLASRSPDAIALLTVVAVLGSTAGNLFLFSLARRGGQIYLEKRSRGKRSRRFRNWFDRYGLLTVFIAALVPLPVMPLKIFVLSAGALGSKPLAFVLTFVGARVPRYLGLAMLGRQMGADAIGYLRANAWNLLFFAIALFLLLYLIVKVADYQKTKGDVVL
jgi:membrane protein DedA with SNARE-associated domain